LASSGSAEADTAVIATLDSGSIGGEKVVAAGQPDLSRRRAR
jgi:hypothetical protein